MASLALLLCLTSITPEKLELLPNMWPWERRALLQKIQPRLEGGQEVAPALIDAGIDPQVVRLLQEIEPGPLLEERYARRLILTVPNLGPDQRRLFDYLLPAADGAERALLVQAERLKRHEDGERLYADMMQRIYRIEKRFWRVAGLVLSQKQRIVLRKRYSPRYAGVPDLLGHVYRLPGLTPSQAARIRALATEFESENAATAAQSARIRARLKQTALPSEERQKAERQAQAVGDAMATRLKQTMERGRAILTEAQRAEMDALVPLVGPGDRTRHPGEMIKGMAITPQQQPRLEALGRRIEQLHKKVQARVEKKSREMQGIGEQSPQAAMMQMAHLGAEAEMIAAFDTAAHEALTAILTPPQVLGWIVGAP